MNESFAAVFEFLAQFSSRVAGHGPEPPAPALRAQVVAFARGELPPTERASLLRQLQTDPALVSYLGETVKRLRGRPTDAGGDPPS